MGLSEIGMAVVSLTLAFPNEVQRRPRNAFPSSTVVESFEGQSGSTYFIPPTIPPYVFASGVRLIAPAPNPGWISGVILIDHFSTQGKVCLFNLCNGGCIQQADIPHGSAYLVADGPICGNDGFMQFGFDEPQSFVGAYVTGTTHSVPTTITLEVFDEFGASIGVVTNHAVPDHAWRDNFLGIEAVGIRSARFSGTNVVVDVLHFAPADQPCSPADLAPPFGVLDQADINAFIGAFVAGDKLADVNSDGLLDLADITEFVTRFLDGCS